MNSGDQPDAQNAGDQTPPRTSDSLIPQGERGAPARQESCWNTIGVYGQRTCVQLTTVVHCRNCAVYSQAAQRLLDIRCLPVTANSGPRPSPASGDSLRRPAFPRSCSASPTNGWRCLRLSFRRSRSPGRFTHCLTGAIRSCSGWRMFAANCCSAFRCSISFVPRPLRAGK